MRTMERAQEGRGVGRLCDWRGVNRVADMKARGMRFEVVQRAVMGGYLRWEDSAGSGSGEPKAHATAAQHPMTQRWCSHDKQKGAPLRLSMLNAGAGGTGGQGGGHAGSREGTAQKGAWCHRVQAPARGSHTPEGTWCGPEGSGEHGTQYGTHQQREALLFVARMDRPPCDHRSPGHRYHR